MIHWKQTPWQKVSFKNTPKGHFNQCLGFIKRVYNVFTHWHHIMTSGCRLKAGGCDSCVWPKLFHCEEDMTTSHTIHITHSQSNKHRRKSKKTKWNHCTGEIPEVYFKMDVHLYHLWYFDRFSISSTVLKSWERLIMQWLRCYLVTYETNHVTMDRSMWPRWDPVLWKTKT